MKKAIIIIGIMVCAYIGLNIGPNVEDVKAYTQTEAYKAQEHSHFAKLTRMEAAR